MGVERVPKAIVRPIPQAGSEKVLDNFGHLWPGQNAHTHISIIMTIANQRKKSWLV